MEKKDHIKIGKELDIFVQSKEVGRGLPLLTPKGAMIKMILKRFIEDEEIKRGYQLTDTPVLTKTDLYGMSGHLDLYRDSMFVFEINDEEYALRPMTCPHQFMIYKSRPRSYRELPIRYAEMADLFRREQSGELHGLIRVWQFMLADGHIICTPDQVEKEFEDALNLVKFIMDSLGFTDYWYKFAKWDPKKKDKYIDNPEAWEKSEAMMKKIIDKLNLKYVEEEGEAAFYGPKLDIQMKNIHGKEDTLFTVQLDFALPEKFDMTYQGKDDKEHRPMIIHRSSIGCLERTIAFLLEKYQGELPVWISPIQAKILSFTDKNVEHATKISEQLREAGIRVENDFRSETVQAKVRDAQIEKIGNQKKQKKISFIKNKPPVSLITTGGTITSKVDYKTGGVISLMKPEELLSTVPELADIIDLRKISSPFNIMSENMRSEHWQKLAEEVASVLKEDKGAIVTHGTDTLHFTAAALSFMLPEVPKPVVLTGSQRSSDRPSSDAFMNLICSSYIAGYSDIASVGICMHSSISDNSCYFTRGTKVKKMHTSRRDAIIPTSASIFSVVGAVKIGTSESIISFIIGVHAFFPFVETCPNPFASIKIACFSFFTK